MAEHVWSVLCHKGCQDKETNQVSLLEVTEKLTIETREDLPDSSAEQERPSDNALVRMPLELVSWWYRSDVNQPETAQARITVMAPDGEKIGESELELPLESTKSFRMISKMAGFPLRALADPGTVWFIVEQKHEESWTTVAKVPLEIEIRQAKPSAKK